MSGIDELFEIGKERDELKVKFMSLENDFKEKRNEMNLKLDKVTSVEELESVMCEIESMAAQYSKQLDETQTKITGLHERVLEILREF